jgi:hypothetical protein
MFESNWAYVTTMLSTQIVQGHVWKKECWHFVGASYDYMIDLKEGV